MLHAIRVFQALKHVSLKFSGMFPNQEVFARTVPSFDAFEDEKTWDAVKELGRKKMVISGLWTSMCFAYTALHTLKEGYEVYGLIDAAGDSTPDAHKSQITTS